MWGLFFNGTLSLYEGKRGIPMFSLALPSVLPLSLSGFLPDLPITLFQIDPNPPFSTVGDFGLKVLIDLAFLCNEICEKAAQDGGEKDGKDFFTNSEIPPF